MNNSSAVSSPESDSAQLEKLSNGCMHCINQCEQLLQQLSEVSYCESREGVSSIGAHMRHILDRFQCFFHGLPAGTIDYDARKRDKSIEANLQAARFAVASISRRLQDLASAGSTELEVTETVHHLSPKVIITSTVARELMSLITHTTHHLAIIGMIARDLGYSLDQDFGKAPSTIVFERS
ncbi:MAG: hypothetical protein MI746_16565 [Pseudomonadales bacterium]|nr:hypothetical protein [Pseudomonadales bacterium]